MYDDTAMIMMLNTLTSVHAGSGTQLSYVDLPIQREVHTGFPKIEASTLKGCIRYAVGAKGEESPFINEIFGMPDKGDFASAVSFSDARLLFFPVKSVIDIFAWVTCPFAIQRFLEDYKLAIGEEFLDNGKLLEIEKTLNIKGALVSSSCKLIPNKQDLNKQEPNKQEPNNQKKIMLEDYTFCVGENEEFKEFLDEIKKHLPDNLITENNFLDHTVLLNNDDFAGFVKYSTEVNTRIKMDPLTGTVDNNALFTEEFLPPECILYNMIFFTKTHNKEKEILNKNDVKAKFKELFKEDIFQIGGDSTLGKGFVIKKFWEKEINAKQ